jgi:hypothetical protein
MQTFLSEPTFEGCASVLDNKRLNKQFLEGRQILSALMTGKGWIHHPATKMWAGHELVLLDYLDQIRWEMGKRNIKTEKNWVAISQLFENNPSFYSNGQLPDWWLNRDTRNAIITTHRGRLYEKNPEHYPQYHRESQVYRNFVCCDRCQYYWPTHIKA